MKRLALCLLAGALAGGWVAPSARGAAVNDPALAKQWGLGKIGAQEAWARATGQGTVIAIVDTGVDLGHEDLQDKIVAHVNCIGSDGDPSRCTGSGQDDHGHGTHVAGIAAAATNNGRGGAGTAPGAGIMAVKVLEPDGLGSAAGDLSDIEAGVKWAVDHGADVVNLSLGEDIVVRGLSGRGLGDAVDYAWSHGAVAVVAAGNDTGLFGSGYEGVDAVVVTATTQADGQAIYATSIGGAQWGIAAPGGEITPRETDDIFSTWWDPDEDNVYAWAIGTSMATPFVSGSIAVLRSLGLSPQQAIDRLLATAVDLGRAGPDSTYGYGRLDLAAATADPGAAPGGGSPTTEPPASPPPPQEPPPAKVAGLGATRAPSPGPATPSPTEVPETPAVSQATPEPTAEATTAQATTAQAAAAPAPAEGDDESTGVPAWLVVASIVLLLGAVGGLRLAAARTDAPA